MDPIFQNNGFIEKFAVFLLASLVQQNIKNEITEMLFFPFLYPFIFILDR